MSKNERKKAGLHKEISSIFKGVVIPHKEGSKESSIASKPDDTDYAVPTQSATESQQNEVSKSYQDTQASPKTEPVQEPKAESVEEPKVESVEEPKVEPAQESKDETDEEPKIESVEEPKDESDEKPKIETLEGPKSESIVEPKAESVEEPEAEPVHTPKFVTDQESKVIPVQESEVEPAEETKDKAVSTPKFVTAQKSKVIPVQESEVEPAQQSKPAPANRPNLEAAKKTKDKATKQPKVIPVQKPKADNKKITKKQTAVKIGKQSYFKQITDKLLTSKSGVSSTKQKAMVVMVPVLFIALLVFVLKGGVFGTSVPNVEAGEENNASGVASAGLSTEIDWEIPEPYPTTLRDPMKLGPVVTGINQDESGELVKLIVKGILYSEDNPSAIIGNRIVHEGDQIQDASVIKINKNSVEFEMNGKKWTQGVQR